MGFAFFVYTLAIMVFSLITSVVGLITYRLSKQRSFLFAAIGFIFYFLDELPIFSEDFLERPTSTSSFYEMSQPGFVIITASGFLLCLWLVYCELIHEKRKTLLALPVLLFVSFSIIVLVTIPAGKWHEFLFYLCRQVFTGWIVTYILARTTANQKLHSHARILGFIVAGIVLEDIVMILILDPSNSSFSDYYMERNFMENIGAFYLSLLTLKASYHVLTSSEHHID